MKNYKKQTYMMRKLVFFLLLVIAVLPMQAKEDVTLTAEAPDVVVSGDQFRLTFTVNTQKDFYSQYPKRERLSGTFHQRI